MGHMQATKLRSKHHKSECQSYLHPRIQVVISFNLKESQVVLLQDPCFLTTNPIPDAPVIHHFQNHD